MEEEKELSCARLEEGTRIASEDRRGWGVSSWFLPFVEMDSSSLPETEFLRTFGKERQALAVELLLSYAAGGLVLPVTY